MIDGIRSRLEWAVPFVRGMSRTDTDMTCEECGRELVPGDLIAWVVDPPDSGPVHCSNPPTCVECVTSWNDETGSWVHQMQNVMADGSVIEWEVVPQR